MGFELKEKTKLSEPTTHVTSPCDECIVIKEGAWSQDQVYYLPVVLVGQLMLVNPNKAKHTHFFFVKD